MQFRVLGPPELSDAGRPVPIPAAMERTLLAALLAEANRVVSVDRLFEALWGDHPPRTASKTLQTYVGHLRRHLGERLAHRSPGYALRVEPGELDAAEFERLVGEGRLALLRGEGARAAELLRQAVGLWRSEPFEGIPLRGSVQSEVIRLSELRLAAVEDWMEARLLDGEHAAVTAELQALVGQHPLRERMWATLMRALYASGRQAEALRVFQQARQRLVEEAGVEPGPQLRAVEAAVLANDPTLRAGVGDRPTCHYATTPDEIRIGYWTKGEGGRDLVFCSEWTMNLELLWDIVELRPLLDRLISSGRLTAVQRRGTGISDRVPGPFPPPQECVPDFDAVLDEIGVERASLVGWGHGGQLALAYAAARPERVADLTLVSGYARLLAAPDYPEGADPDAAEIVMEVIESIWGQDVPKYVIFDPSVATDPGLIARMSRTERLIATPREAVEIQRAVNSFDVRDLLPAVTCPTLVLALSQSVTGVAAAQYLADHLASAEFVELPGHFVPTVDQTTAVAAAIEDFHRRHPG